MAFKSQSSHHTGSTSNEKSRDRQIPAHLYDDSRAYSSEDFFETRGRFSDFVACGVGSYGSVYRAKDNKTGKTVAIKRVHKVFINISTAKYILREIRILRLLQKRQKKNIVGFCGLLEPENEDSFVDLFMVFEVFDADLARFLPSNQFFNNSQIQCFMFQLLVAVQYIHSQSVIHRDLKPGNILVNANCSLVVCDFGLARLQLPPASTFSSVFAAVRAVKGAISCILPKWNERPCEDSNDRSRSSSSNNGGSDCSVNNLHGDSTSSHASSSSSSTNKIRTSGSRVSRGDEGNMIDLTQDSPAVCIPSADEMSLLWGASISSDESQSPLPYSRTMTRHVSTRWYRAPEVSLAADYTSAIDLWSVGCIFADLLSMQKENFAHPNERQVLFPGDSSIFTPLKKDATHRSEHLEVIFDVLGPPKIDELERMCKHSEDGVKPYVFNLASSKRRQEPRDLRVIYPGADPLAISLLQGLLTFDPTKRLTAQQALQHPYLQSSNLKKLYGCHSEPLEDLSLHKFQIVRCDNGKKSLLRW